MLAESHADYTQHLALGTARILDAHSLCRLIDYTVANLSLLHKKTSFPHLQMMEVVYCNAEIVVLRNDIC